MPLTRKRPAPPPASFVKASKILSKRSSVTTRIFDSGDEEILDAAMIQAGLDQTGAGTSTELPPAGQQQQQPPPVNKPPGATPGTSGASRPPPPLPKDDRLDRILQSISSLSGKFDSVKSDVAKTVEDLAQGCLLYTSPSPRD